MLNDDPEPNILELQKMIEALCRHLRDIRGEVTDADMGKELSQYLATLEEGNKGLVAEYAQAKSSYDAARDKARRMQEELQKQASAPEPPVEEDVLPLGLALRSQLLQRYGIPRAAPAAPVPAGEAWEVASAAFRAAEAEQKYAPPPKKPGARPPKPKAKEPQPPADEDVTDLTSGEWRSPD